TGVQTCALPILIREPTPRLAKRGVGSRITTAVLPCFVSRPEAMDRRKNIFSASTSRKVEFRQPDGQQFTPSSRFLRTALADRSRPRFQVNRKELRHVPCL